MTGNEVRRPLRDNGPVLVDDFTGPTLDPGLWIDHYLPH